MIESPLTGGELISFSLRKERTHALQALRKLW